MRTTPSTAPPRTAQSGTERGERPRGDPALRRAGESGFERQLLHHVRQANHHLFEWWRSAREVDRWFGVRGEGCAFHRPVAPGRPDLAWVVHLGKRIHMAWRPHR